MKKTVIFALLMTLGVLLVAEGMLQVLAVSSRSVRAALSITPIRGFIPDRRLSWRGNPEFPGHDSLGFRNPGVPSEAEVVALGDSQTYGSNVRPEEAWPHRLDDLGVGQTYNAAFPGWGPLQSLLSLDQTLALRPQKVVAALYLGNDLVDSFTFVYHRNRLEEFKSSDEETLRAVDDAADAQPWDDNPIANQSPIDRDEWDRRDVAPQSPGELIQAHSRLYGLWYALGRAYHYYSRHPERPEADSDQDPLRDDDFFRFRGAHFRTVLTPSYRLPAVKLDDPRVAEGLRITVEALDRMHERSEAAGADFAVVLIPTKELALANVVAAEVGRLPTDLAFQASAEERAREALRERLAAEDIPVIDALPALQSLAANGVLPYSETRDGHLNPSGHWAVAEVVKDALDSESDGTSAADRS